MFCAVPGLCRYDLSKVKDVELTFTEKRSCHVNTTLGAVFATLSVPVFSVGL